MGKNYFDRVLWTIRRKKYTRKMRKQLLRSDFTIFSCNCIGGILYNDLGLPFSSPFVNLYLSCADFIRFCEDPKSYLRLPLVSCASDHNYPLAKLGDLTLHLVHYESFDQAKEAWERRIERIRFDRLYLIATDRDGYTPELSTRFDSLPYPKVLFVHKPDGNPNHFYIPGYESNGELGDITKKADPKSGKRIMDQFDWVNFLNQQSQIPPK